MKITIISVGTIKEKYLKDAIAEYKKRISKYSLVEEITVADEPIKEKSSELQNEEVKEKEAQRIIAKIPLKSYKIALNLKGEMLSSEELASKINQIATYNSSHITFIIGGSLGLGNSVLRLMDYHLCFSKMTFPHQLMKVILLEQVYRSFKILNHETYHK